MDNQPCLINIISIVRLMQDKNNNEKYIYQSINSYENNFREVYFRQTSFMKNISIKKLK